MNKVKVEKIVDVFCDEIKLDNGRYRKIIQELMGKIITEYESSGIEFIEDEQEYIIKNPNNRYTVEDFLLNRLLFNITSFIRKEEGDRAYYDPSLREIVLNTKKLSTLLDRYKYLNFDENQKFNAGKKVVMHEVEHALQTSFEKGPHINDCEHYKSLYNKLKKIGLDIELNPIYDGRKLLPLTGTGKKIESGVMGVSKKDTYYKFCGTIHLDENDKNYIKENNINEILNESESLLMSNSDENLIISFPQGTKIKVRNIESSNYLITNYGFMLRMILGKERIFKGMYQNRKEIIDYINVEFGDVFQSVFGEHFKKKYPQFDEMDAWALLHLAINSIKYSYEEGKKDYSEICHQKLNLALSICFERIIKERIAHGENVEFIKQEWIEFKNLCLFKSEKEKNDELAHMQVLYDLKSYVIKQNLLNNNSFRQYVQPGLK